MSSIRALAARRTLFLFTQRAAFSQSIARASGKESALHSEGRSEEVEQKKQENLQKQKEGKGHWEEGLASDSESAIKADRNESNTSTNEQIKKLQKEAEKVAGKS
ncbi:hypothetical protein EK21DRAFT_99350 [Setomelanomma holmii]|uniref:Uncharacterized protein n=1 Tax=Setomelanomma holmii TaxID=210430 RepID=A0A9P4HEW8_9PLEO|nr:hypothetical protein EK21DRAFT_99350 [Setomelanomma holmii]